MYAHAQRIDVEASQTVSLVFAKESVWEAMFWNECGVFVLRRVNGVCDDEGYGCTRREQKESRNG